MNAKIKSSLLIIIVLLIGIAIGFEISEISIGHRFDRLDSFRESKGFIKMFESIIKPDSAQKPVIDSILTKYHYQMDKIAKNGMQEVSLQMDSMRADLSKILDKDKSLRLVKEITRMKRQPPPLPPDGRGPIPPAGERPHPPHPGDAPPPQGEIPPPPPGE
jgi:hypothetical protein